MNYARAEDLEADRAEVVERRSKRGDLNHRLSRGVFRVAERLAREEVLGEGWVEP